MTGLYQPSGVKWMYWLREWIRGFFFFLVDFLMPVIKRERTYLFPLVQLGPPPKTVPEMSRVNVSYFFGGMAAFLPADASFSPS